MRHLHFIAVHLLLLRFAASSFMPPFPRRPRASRTPSPFGHAVVVTAASVTPSPSSKKKKFKKGANSSSNDNNSKNNTRTQSFHPLWSGSLDGFEREDSIVEPHTLILGTHPSVTSLQKQQSYAHPMNAFWWIAGDCLGFRRDAAVSLSTNKPYKFEKALRFGLQDIVPYREQVRILVQQGFCLWDVVQSCVRPGSLDVDIKQEVPNDIRTFCETHPSIRRIVLANGGTASAMFKKHFKEWWESGHLQAGSDAMSQAAFGKQSQKAKKKTSVMDDRVITCICAISVSPAAAKYSYEQKRDFWDLHIYKPGLTERQRLTNPIKFD